MQLKDMGISQNDVAKQFGLTQQMISRIKTRDNFLLDKNHYMVVLIIKLFSLLMLGSIILWQENTTHAREEVGLVVGGAVSIHKRH